MVPDHVVVTRAHPKEVDYVPVSYRHYFDIIQIGHKANPLHRITKIHMTIDAANGITDLINFDLTRCQHPLVVVQV